MITKINLNNNLIDIETFKNDFKGMLKILSGGRRSTTTYKVERSTAIIVYYDRDLPIKATYRRNNIRYAEGLIEFYNALLVYRQYSNEDCLKFNRLSIDIIKATNNINNTPETILGGLYRDKTLLVTDDRAYTYNDILCLINMAGEVSSKGKLKQLNFDEFTLFLTSVKLIIHS